MNRGLYEVISTGYTKSSFAKKDLEWQWFFQKIISPKRVDNMKQPSSSWMEKKDTSA